MQLRQPPSPDALVSFSDFLLERFGLVATMQVAIIASIAIHAFAIVGIGFRMIGGGRDEPHNVMDVVLVNSKSANRPDKADALAQANLAGGGNTDEKVHAATPFPAVDPRDPSEQLRAAQAKLKELDRESKEMMTQINSKAAIARQQMASADAQKAETAARDYITASQEIQALQATIARQQRAYELRPKKTFIGSRTMESRFAVYIDKWRARIERIGTLNYPEQARARKIYASLRITVGINVNGEVESVEINRKSGYKFIDEAALRIVRLSAPFEPLPPEIRKDTDILYVVRTWSFTRADEVVTGAPD